MPVSFDNSTIRSNDATTNQETTSATLRSSQSADLRATAQQERSSFSQESKMVLSSASKLLDALNRNSSPDASQYDFRFTAGEAKAYRALYENQRGNGGPETFTKAEMDFYRATKYDSTVDRGTALVIAVTRFKELASGKEEDKQLAADYLTQLIETKEEARLFRELLARHTDGILEDKLPRDAAFRQAALNAINGVGLPADEKALAAENNITVAELASPAARSLGTQRSEPFVEYIPIREQMRQLKEGSVNQAGGTPSAASVAPKRELTEFERVQLDRATQLDNLVARGKNPVEQSILRTVLNTQLSPSELNATLNADMDEYSRSKIPLIKAIKEQNFRGAFAEAVGKITQKDLELLSTEQLFAMYKQQDGLKLGWGNGRAPFLENNKFQDLLGDEIQKRGLGTAIGRKAA